MKSPARRIAHGTSPAVAEQFAADPVAVINAPAMPTLAAVKKLKPAMDWLEIAEKGPRWLLDPKDSLSWHLAEARLLIIPPQADLERAADLLDRALTEAAPRQWLHLAIGGMLDAMPNAGKVTALYRHTLIDLMSDDDFSPPVVVQAIREILKTVSFVPVPAELLAACRRQRAFFEQQRARVEQLLELRANAEDAQAQEAAAMVEWGDDDMSIVPEATTIQTRKDHDVRDVPF